MLHEARGTSATAKLYKNEDHPAISWLELLQFGDGVGCDCDALNGTLVASPADSEEAILAPAGAPAVLHDPVLLSRHVAAAVPHQQHGVVGQLEGVEGVGEACVVVDAPLIVHEVRIHLRKRGRTEFDLLLHCNFNWCCLFHDAKNEFHFVKVWSIWRLLGVPSALIHFWFYEFPKMFIDWIWY